ncbi:hypothetical protein PI95_023270 [Hassallia byssoidea VB512170]|uniref:Uncharacterized protein n=1 Tax=Hassallia byssoidea VB512170 TaxID=1304833 RepID=A0A846HDK9_9CYAN|nr:hypothetical protein [Hassalia byssoidea]NEU75396.1 hypothetical protein [Hassalia byssoidea VB512170]
MTKKWILYSKEDWQVKWPTCINKLSPVKNKNPLEGESLAELREAHTWTDTFDEMILSIRSVSILGTCSTAEYLECPNIPDHHRENARLYGGHPSKYFHNIGRYYWVDFDIITSDKLQLKLRMVVNEGDADCNDGQWVSLKIDKCGQPSSE